MPGYDGTWMWSMGVGMLFMLVFWALVIAGTVWLVLTLTRDRSSAGGGGDKGANALRILEDRLARGEIDVEEFRTRKGAILEARR